MDTPKLIIYGFSKTRAFRALWAAEEAGIDYENKPIDFSKGEHLSDWFLKINPSGKVPAASYGDLSFFESGALVNFILSLKPDKTLIPIDLKERALYDQWCFFCLTELEQPLWTFAKHKFALPKDLRVPQIFDTLPKEFDKALNTINKALDGNKYLLGEHFSGADILVGHTLFWAYKLEKFSTDLNNINPYIGRLRKREAFKNVTGKTKS